MPWQAGSLIKGSGGKPDESERRIIQVKLPSTGGTYVLWLHLKKGRQIDVGRLGAIHFKRGWYAYVGSAFGPGGLAARLGRHLLKEKTLRWHIDYLRAIAQPRKIWLSTDSEPAEHDWAGKISQAKGAPIMGFGCSDCRCASHLFYFNRYPDQLQSALNVPQALLQLKIKQGL